MRRLFCIMQNSSLHACSTDCKSSYAVLSIMCHAQGGRRDRGFGALAYAPQGLQGGQGQAMRCASGTSAGPSFSSYAYSLSLASISSTFSSAALAHTNTHDGPLVGTKTLYS